MANRLTLSKTGLDTALRVGEPAAPAADEPTPPAAPTRKTAAKEPRRRSSSRRPTPATTPSAPPIEAVPLRSGGAPTVTSVGVDASLDARLTEISSERGIGYS